VAAPSELAPTLISQGGNREVRGGETGKEPALVEVQGDEAVLRQMVTILCPGVTKTAGSLWGHQAEGAGRGYGRGDLVAVWDGNACRVVPELVMVQELAAGAAKAPQGDTEARGGSGGEDSSPADRAPAGSARADGGGGGRGRGDIGTRLPQPRPRGGIVPTDSKPRRR
jgi:hypothetical protein